MELTAGSIMLLVKTLRAVDPKEAMSMEDRYSFVLDGLLTDEVKDWEQVRWMNQDFIQAIEGSNGNGKHEGK